MCRSIRFKIWLHMMGIIAAVIVLMWLLGIVFLQNFYEFSKEYDAKQVQNEVVSILSRDDIASSYRNVLNISKDNDMFIEVYDSSGALVISPFMYFDSSDSQMSMQTMMTTIATSNIVKDMINNGERSKIVKLTNENKRGKSSENVVLIDKMVNSEASYYIASRTSLMPVQATAEILNKLFKIILIFVLIVSLILAATLSSSVTRPISALSNGAKAVAGGDYSVYIPIRHNDEIGALTNDFNEMTKELGKVDSVRKDLIANVSHELRTPLTMIKGYAETIRDITGDNKEKREKQLSVIVDESDRLSTLISSILDLSQLQAGKISFNYEEADISGMIKKLVKRYDIFREQGYTINCFVSDGIKVNADYSRLEQVICNLVDNAINHSVDTKIVNIFLDKNGKFSVQNFGDVIEPENIKNIWDRYYKIDKVGNRRVTGTGIGLSIVKEILNSHNFDFGVTSNKESGTIFWVMFKNK